MDIATLIGIIFGIGAIVGSILLMTPDMGMFVSGSSFGIVFGGMLANIPPNTIPKLDPETNIPISGVIRRILPTIAPIPNIIPIKVAISMINPLSGLLI